MISLLNSSVALELEDVSDARVVVEVDLQRSRVPQLMLGTQLTPYVIARKLNEDPTYHPYGKDWIQDKPGVLTWRVWVSDARRVQRGLGRNGLRDVTELQPELHWLMDEVTIERTGLVLPAKPAAQLDGGAGLALQSMQPVTVGRPDAPINAKQPTDDQPFVFELPPDVPLDRKKPEIKMNKEEEIKIKEEIIS